MAEPKFFSKNYVNAESIIVVNYGDGSKANLYDRDKDSKWQSSGANSNATTIGISVEFYKGSVAVNRTIDSLILLNHNLKRWTFYYWNGSAWVSLASETTDAAEHTAKSFNAVTTSKVKIECDQTQTADAEKFIGEMFVGEELLDLGEEITSYDVRYRDMGKETPLGDGGIHKMVTRWAQNRTQRYECTARFQFLDDDQRADLKDLRDSGEPFTWQPESTSRPEELFLVHWSTPWQEKYVTSYKGAGSEISMGLKEV